MQGTTIHLLHFDAGAWEAMSLALRLPLLLKRCKSVSAQEKMKSNNYCQHTLSQNNACF